MPFVAASSEHPLATHAVGEVVGTVLERLGPEPDLVVVFVTGPFAGAMSDVASTIRELLRPRHMVGATAVSVLAGPHEIEERAAVSVFAASWGRRRRRGTRTVRFGAERDDGGWRLTGSDAVVRSDGTLLLLADPASFPVEGFVEELGRRAPDLTVVGGLASVPPTVGANALVADGHVFDSGAVGVLLPSGVPVRAFVSQGCRPVGQPLVVTAATGNLVEEIAGRPALDRLMETVEAADPDVRRSMGAGLQLGLVVDESSDEPGPGDVLVRPVLGAERSRRAVAVTTEVEVGTTVQFQVRDAASADDDLWDTLAGEHADGALVFTCNARGTQLFDAPDHDASVVDAHVTHGATAGMFCAGEIGPVAGRTFVHGHSTAVLLFDD